MLVYAAIAGSANPVIKLAPPKISEETRAIQVTCVRPMRNGKVNISAQNVGNKFVVHCYGHGGSGWTTFLGSVDRAIELLQTRYHSPLATPPIRIIGSGCIGLTSAIELARRGYVVSGIMSKELYNIPSWKAAGCFSLVKVASDLDEVFDQITLSTFKYYQTIEKGEHPYLSSAAVRLLPLYCSPDNHSGVEYIEEKGLIPPREIVDIDFQNGTVHRNFKKFMTYFFNVTTFMKDLHQEVSRLAIPITLETIESFDEINEEVVFNCAGIGGGKLASDDTLVPVRGHLLILNEDIGQDHMDYMVDAKVIQDGKDEYVYMVPKDVYNTAESPESLPCFGILGGTYLPNVDLLPPEDLAKLDDFEFKQLLERHLTFFGLKK